MTTTEIITKYCEDKDDITDETKATYIKQADKFGGKLINKMSYNYMMKKLNEEFGASPSSQLQGVHILMVATKENKPRVFEKLQKLKNELKKSKDDGVKEKNEKKLNTLPSYDYLIQELNKIENENKSLAYFINFIMINYGFRNQDFDMIYIKSKKEFDAIKKEKLGQNNYIYHNQQTKQIELFIQVYKTASTYGAKHIIIRDEPFIRHFKNLKIENNHPVFTTKDGTKVSPSYLSDILYNYSIDKLREANIFKIIVKHLIDTKDFTKLDQYVKTRGTSMAEIMKSYNIQRVDKKPEPEPEPDEEGGMGGENPPK
jgi:hypothetical protein